MLILTKSYAVKTGQPRFTIGKWQKMQSAIEQQIYEKYLVIVIKVHLQ